MSAAAWPDRGDRGRHRHSVRPPSLVALNRVRDEDSGLASRLLNAGQQIGGVIGLAVLGTVTWTVAAS
jgi:hypothetical protein